MSRHISTLNLHLEPADNQRLASLCGPFDDNLKQLERRLGIEISYRDNHFQVIGKQAQVEAAAVILKHLYVETQPLKGSKVSDITPEMVHLAVQESRVLEQDDEPALPCRMARRSRSRPSAVSSSPAARTRPSTSPISCATTSASASGPPGPARPISPWPPPWMPWSARRSAASC